MPFLSRKTPNIAHEIRRDVIELVVLLLLLPPLVLHMHDLPRIVGLVVVTFLLLLLHLIRVVVELGLLCLLWLSMLLCSTIVRASTTTASTSS